MRLWCSIMRLLVSNRVRGEFGRTREMSLLLRHLTALRSGTRVWFHRYPTLRCSRLRGHCRTRGLA